MVRTSGRAEVRCHPRLSEPKASRGWPEQVRPVPAMTRCNRSASKLGGRLSPALGHELVELLLVPGFAQANEELLEFALLLLQALERLGAVIVEGLVAAPRTRRLPPGSATVSCLHPTIPVAHVAVLPAAHASAPDDEGQGGQTDRPPERETQDHEGDPGWFSQLVYLRNYRHFRPRREC